MTEWNGHFMKWLKYPAITWNGWYHTLTVTYIAYSSLCARSTMYRPMQRRGKRGSRGTCPQTLTEVGQCLPTLARLKCCIFYKNFLNLPTSGLLQASETQNAPNSFCAGRGSAPDPSDELTIPRLRRFIATYGHLTSEAYHGVLFYNVNMFTKFYVSSFTSFDVYTMC